MSGRVHMRAPLPDERVGFSEKSLAERAFAFLVPIDRLPFFVGKTGPARDARLKGVGQVDHLFAGQDLLDTREAWLLRVHGSAESGGQKSRRDNRYHSNPHVRCVKASRNNKPTTSNKAEEISSASFPGLFVGRQRACYQHGLRRWSPSQKGGKAWVVGPPMMKKRWVCRERILRGSVQNFASQSPLIASFLGITEPAARLI